MSDGLTTTCGTTTTLVQQPNGQLTATAAGGQILQLAAAPAGQAGQAQAQAGGQAGNLIVMLPGNTGASTLPRFPLPGEHFCGPSHCYRVFSGLILPDNNNYRVFAHISPPPFPDFKIWKRSLYVVLSHFLKIKKW
jgi:hypothetical protein